MKINAATGLPELPEGYFYKIEEVNGADVWGISKNWLVISIRKKRWLGSKVQVSTWLEITGAIDDEVVADAAIYLHDKIEQEIRLKAITRMYTGTYK